MKKALLLAALLLTACKDKPKEAPAAKDAAPVAKVADAAPAAGTLQVVMISYKLNETFAEEELSETTMKIGDNTVTDREKERSTIKIVGVIGPAISQVEVKYDAHEVTRSAGDQSETTPSPLAGNTYTVAKKTDKLEIARADGKKVSGEEHDLIADDFVELGQVPVIVEVVRNRIWKQGERVDLTGNELAELGQRGGSDKAIQPKTGWLTWTGMDGELATFEGELTVRREDDSMAIDSTVKTSFSIEPKTARIRVMKTEGTMKGELRGKQAAPIEGTLASTTTIKPQ